ncbi:MAG: lysophospholipid acyltransferase family protein [Anaerolineales bacterium]|jgi:lauroyl/myristoyl acyltransferase
MRIDPQTIFNSRYVVGIAYGLARALPPRSGYKLAAYLADRVSARQNWNLVQAVRANQWVIHNENINPSELDRLVQQTFRHTAKCIYDLYHHIKDPASLDAWVDINPRAAGMLDDYRNGRGSGLVVVGAHVSNFDLVAQCAARQGFKAQVMTLPDIDVSGYQWQNDLRRNSGLDITPVSLAAIRQAYQTLEQGGIVLSGLDRPLADGKYRPNFFGRPAQLPTFYVNFALKAKVPVLVVAANWDSDGKYHILLSEPITMQPHPDRDQEIIQNAERVLREAEKFICKDPEQWLMFYPVWPEVQPPAQAS